MEGEGGGEWGGGDVVTTVDLLNNQEDKLREMQLALDARLRMDGEMRKVEKIMEDLESNRAKQVAASKRTLTEQLESLDKQTIEIVERWNNDSDFSKIDLVCAELVKKGSYHDTLKYMEKVQVLISNVCQKLARKAYEVEGVAIDRYKLHNNGNFEMASSQKIDPRMSGGVVSGLRRGNSTVMQSMKEAKPPTTKTIASKKYQLEEPHNAGDLAEIRTLNSRVKELGELLEKASAAGAGEKTKRREVEKSLKQAHSRLQQRGLEVQSLSARVNNLEGRLSGVDESNKGLQVLLRKKDEEMRTRAMGASRLHHKIMTGQIPIATGGGERPQMREGLGEDAGGEEGEGGAGGEGAEEGETATLEEEQDPRELALRAKALEVAKLQRELRELREHVRKRGEESKGKDEQIAKLTAQVREQGRLEGESSRRSMTNSPYGKPLRKKA